MGKTFKHEDLHSLGASHQAIGGDNDNFNSVNDRVIGAIFKTVSARISNLSIKAKNYKRKDALVDDRSVNRNDIPKVKASTNSSRGDIKLNGTIIQLTK